MLSGAFSCSACESGLSGRNLLDKLGMHCLNVFRECCFEDRDPDTAVEIPHEVAQSSFCDRICRGRFAN